MEEFIEIPTSTGPLARHMGKKLRCGHALRENGHFDEKGNMSFEWSKRKDLSHNT